MRGSWQIAHVILDGRSEKRAGFLSVRAWSHPRVHLWHTRGREVSWARARGSRRPPQTQTHPQTQTTTDRHRSATTIHQASRTRGLKRARCAQTHCPKAKSEHRRTSEAERSAPFPTAFALTASFSFIPLIRTPARGKKAAPARGKKAATQSATQVEER